MTNLEALTAKVGYPLSEDSFKIALEVRGLNPPDTFAPGQSFDLAYADSLVTVVTSANVSEGGFSVSVTDREVFINIITDIYARYGERNPLVSSMKPTARFVRRW